MTDTNEPGFSKRNKPVAIFLVVLPFLIVSGFVGGREVATGEINTQKLDSYTASGKIVKARVNVPPGGLIEAAVLEESPTFANRIVGDEAALSEIVGKKARYGLNARQVVMRQDLE